MYWVFKSNWRHRCLNVVLYMMFLSLQHPSLTPGQKRYLYSIASVYSTDHMRRQMRQHYLNILRSCTATGGTEWPNSVGLWAWVFCFCFRALRPPSSNPALHTSHLSLLGITDWIVETVPRLVCWIYLTYLIESVLISLISVRCAWSTHS